MDHPRPLFHFIFVLSNKHYSYTTNKWEKCPSTKWCYRANFHCCKWPNISKIIAPSGHTARNGICEIRDTKNAFRIFFRRNLFLDEFWKFSLIVFFASSSCIEMQNVNKTCFSHSEMEQFDWILQVTWCIFWPNRVNYLRLVLVIILLLNFSMNLPPVTCTRK